MKNTSLFPVRIDGGALFQMKNFKKILTIIDSEIEKKNTFCKPKYMFFDLPMTYASYSCDPCRTREKKGNEGEGLLLNLCKQKVFLTDNGS